MGTFSIWHWLIVISIFGIPAIAVKTERSGKAISRTKFLSWVLGWIAYIVIMRVVGGIGIVSETAAPLFIGLQFLGMLVYFTLYYRLMVKRLRNAGQGKTLAYLAIVPIANILIPIYLLFAPPRTAEQPTAV